MADSKKFEKKEVAKNILLTLGVVGIVSLALVAPGISKAFPLLRKINLSRFNQEIKRLHKRGLVEIIKRKNGLVSLKLTSTGKEKIKRYQLDKLFIDRSQGWDKKWRIIIFDIPVKKNSNRTLLRRKMKNLGFYKLQASVFISPYPCLEIVEFLRSYFNVKNEVEYIEAENLESQNILLEYFFT